MTIRHLLSVFLVLLQSGLTAHAHTHTHPDLAKHTDVPHIHVHDLLDLFGPGHGDEDDHDGDDHDADAVDLSAVSVSAAPPVVAAISLDLAPAYLGSAFTGSTEPTFPVGLPPTTAGPHRPLYLTLCTLTI